VVGAVIAAGLVGAAIVLPWLTLLPVHGIAAALAHAFTLIAAFHGAGLVIARLAHQRDASPWLVISWGLAALCGLSGVAIAAGLGTLAGQAALVFGFVAVHTGTLAVGFARHTGLVRASLAGPRTWLVPAALLALLGTLAVLGAAGETLPRPFDDEGHVLAQLRRVLDTGALADPIGYPRRAGLGAQIALAAVAAGAGDAFARFVEPLALVLALGLAGARLRARDPGAALWAALLIVTAFGLALAPADPLPCWTAVVLTVALYTMLGEAEPPPALPLAITASALIALRFELAPIALVAVIAAWWPRRADHRRTAILLGGVIAACGPFLVARMIAWRAVPAIAHAAFAPPREAAHVVRLLLAAAIAIPASFVLRLALPERRTRWVTIATAVALGALAAHVTGAGPYALRLAWPIGIAFAIVLVVELAGNRSIGASLVPSAGASLVPSPGASLVPSAGSSLTPSAGASLAPSAGASLVPSPGSSLVPSAGSSLVPLPGASLVPSAGSSLVPSPGASLVPSLGPAALITALVLGVFLQEGREAPGRLRWSRRLAAAATDIEALRRPPGDGAERYAELLASVPPDATVAVWVAEPERLDYARHRIIDLRTPAGARLREFRWAAHASALAPLLAQLPAAFLLIEADDAHVQRVQTDLLYRFVCQTERPICADDLEAIALGRPIAAQRDRLRLVDLRR